MNQQKVKLFFKETKPGLNACVLAEDCQTLYSSSYIGQVFVWRHLGDKWYDIARYVNEDDTFCGRGSGTK